MDRYLNMLNAVIAGPTGLLLKARKAWQSDPANWMALQIAPSATALQLDPRSSHPSRGLPLQWSTPVKRS